MKTLIRYSILDKVVPSLFAATVTIAVAFAFLRGIYPFG